jgi:rhamnulokinase
VREDFDRCAGRKERGCFRTRYHLTIMLQLLAIDLGAESGRAILGRLDGGVLVTEEVHRFPNEPVLLGETLCWDFPRLLLEVKRGIALAARSAGGRLDGIAADSWGVDFGLLGRDGSLLANPVHYRDARTRGAMEKVFRRLPREAIFEITGIQFLELNTLYQLAALRERCPELLQAAGKLLLVAGLMSYFLCGQAAAELTLASTTQLLDARRRQWAPRLAEAIGIPRALLPDLVEAGTVLAPLREDIRRETGLAAAPPVIACASHDTASAVAAVPADGGRWGFLSSGTWSLLGLELDEPRIGPESLEANFTNEAGACGTIRFLRNINGLWLVQECRRQWAREGEDIDYERLAELAAAAPPAAARIDPNDPEFFAAGDMPRRIQEACRRSGQPAPESKGAIIRCALESLASTYGAVLRRAEAIAGTQLERLHVVGGGSRHRLFNRLTAEVLRLPVIAGPSEATAMGNILIQAMALGEIDGLAALRRIVARSAALEEVEI